MSDRNNSYGNYAGRWPAVVREYDGERRLCRVEIPGVTDGAETLPNAEVEYPIGDKTRGELATEIEILPGDAVWVDFIGGDPRYPIITGYRNPSAANESGTRRWHHKAIELQADESITLKVGDSTITITGGAIALKSGRIDLN